MSALSKYAEKLRACPAPGGGVNNWCFGCAVLAAIAGVPPAQALAEISAAMTRPPRPGEVERAVERACQKQGERAALGAAYVPAPKPPKPKPAPATFARYVEKGRAARGDARTLAACLADASLPPIDWKRDPRRDARTQLRAMFREGETVWCGKRSWGEARTREEWCAAFEAGGRVPPLVCVNPVRPDFPRGEGNPPKQSDIAAFRHTLAEFDGPPLEEQLFFFTGWGLQNTVSLTFSGGKSIHAVLYLHTRERAEWERRVKPLFGKFLIPFGCDPNNSDANRKTRLAGAWRHDERVKGKRQRLIYVGEFA